MANEQEKGKAGLRWRDIWRGAFATTGIIFLLIIAASILYGMTSGFCNVNDTTMVIIQVCTALICYVFGGFVVGGRAERRGALHGLLSALVVSIILLIIILILMLNSGESAGYIFVSSAIILLILPVFGALGGYLGERLRNRKTPSTNNPSS